MHEAVLAGRRAQRALAERVKELRCLYAFTQLVETHGDDLPSLLQAVAELLPSSWQYPGDCCARVVLQDRHYTSDGFRETPWKQSAPIKVHGSVAGTLEIFYTVKSPEESDGSLQAKDRALIDGTAERLTLAIDRIHSRKMLRETVTRLRSEQASLYQANTVIRGLLLRIEDQKQAVRDSVAANVDQVVMPLVGQIYAEVSPEQKDRVAMLRQQLEGIVSPFVDRLSKAFTSLTPVEVRVCNMVRDGLPTKEIARIRNVSPATVSRQREQIRKKLGLAGQDANLATFLQTFLKERPATESTMTVPPLPPTHCPVFIDDLVCEA